MPFSRSHKFTVVVADRAHAHVYETSRLGEPMERIATIGNPNARMHERDLGSGAPGRSFNRSSGVHQTFAPRHSLREHDAGQFARVIGRTVELSIRTGKSDGIVLVAAPRMLSAIRRALPKTVHDKVVREVAKDLVHQPKRVIVEHLRAA